MFDPQTAFSNKKDFGREAREAAWAAEQRTLHGLQPTSLFEKSSFAELNLMAEEAKRRAEIARLAFRFGWLVIWFESLSVLGLRMFVWC